MELSEHNLTKLISQQAKLSKVKREHVNRKAAQDTEIDSKIKQIEDMEKAEENAKQEKARALKVQADEMIRSVMESGEALLPQILIILKFIFRLEEPRLDFV